MNERIDHAAEALDALIAVSNIEEPLTVANLLAEAQTHATLALVEQQRIANLIALATNIHTPLADQPATDAMGALVDYHPHENDEFGGWFEANPDVAAALGIETEGAS